MKKLIGVSIISERNLKLKTLRDIKNRNVQYENKIVYFKKVDDALLYIMKMKKELTV